jgi:NhaP-type Na+/H+ or K+/H+ antiporter
VEGNVLVVAVAVLVFGLFAGRLRGTSITAPMVFTAAGLLLGKPVLGILDAGAGSGVVSALAEATLVVVLFTDASRMDLRTVAREHSLALRLLLMGLPLAIAVGAGAGALLLPALPLAAAGLLAVTLAPTDAALGQSFVNNHSVPQRIRQTLNVESGLNDGLAVPFLTVLLDVAAHKASSAGSYVVLLVQLVGVGVAVGLAVGWLGGRALLWSASKSWATDSAQRLGTVALPAIAYAGSGMLGGNGFVASFVAGLAVGTSARSLLKGTTAFAEAEGQFLTLLTFLLFGSVVAGQVLSDVSWQVVGYALVSLLLVRPIAVALSLLGSGVAPSTTAFIGWAGPRGLASIVYAVLIADAHVPGGETVFSIAAWTILFSIVLHGLTAAPASDAYGRRIKQRPGDKVPERRHVSHLPVRLPPFGHKREQQQQQQQQQQQSSG